LYDADPRKHLARMQLLLSAGRASDYIHLRYAALDVRLSIETTLQEELTASYSTFSDDFRAIWRTRHFEKVIRSQKPDFDLKNSVTPLVILKRKQIADYEAIDLTRLSDLHHELSDHLHHLNRYDYAKGSEDRASLLFTLIESTASYLAKLLKYPRIGVEFHGADETFFQSVVKKERSLEDFKQHIMAGRLKEVTLKSAQHQPQ